MIIGTITLITILLGGATYNTFVFEDLDKNIKKVVIDKERKKEIASELKMSEKEIKDYYKARGKRIKALKTVNIDRGATREQFDSIYQIGVEKRNEIDRFMIEARLMIIQKLSDEEWNSVMAMSVEKANNQKSKEEEKALKGKIKNIFDKLRGKIDKSIPDEDRKSTILKSVQTLESTFEDLENSVINQYPTDNEVLISKNADESDLDTIFSDVLVLRKELYYSFIDFHFEILDQTNEKEWKQIMKEFNKLIQ